MYLSLVENDVSDATHVRDLAARARDRVRFEEDALALADDAYRVARRLTQSASEAEDLVQEAYVRAFRSWEQYKPGTNLRAWLLRIVHNLAIDASRKRARTPQTEPVEEGDYYLYNRLGGAAAPDESEAALERLSQGNVVSALAALPHQYRDTVVLVDLAEFSYQDAADILDVPIGTVMSRLHRGRRMLKTSLAETLDDEAGKDVA
jgi:RNA polymerase sigma-70 factor (ECF subfamily)